MRYTEAQASERGLYFSMIMDKKRLIVYVDGYNFYYGQDGRICKQRIAKSIRFLKKYNKSLGVSERSLSEMEGLLNFSKLQKSDYCNL